MTSAQRAPLRSLTRLAACCTLLIGSWVTHAAPVQLVVNGEFETPGIDPNNWACVANASVPGWSSSAGCLEIWGADFTSGNALPVNGSDGLAHGQHHELTYFSDTEFTTQAAAIVANGYVDFSFDGWRRNATGIVWSLSGSLSGLLAGGTLALGDDNWHAASATGLFVQAGETLTMRFQSTGLQPPQGCSGTTGCGAHIDQVSLLYTVPEPATLSLLGTALLGLGLSRRRSSRRA